MNPAYLSYNNNVSSEGEMGGVRIDLLPNINQATNHGLVVFWLKNMVKANRAAKNIP